MNILNISQSFKIVGGSDVYFRSLTELLQYYGMTVDEFASLPEDSEDYPKELDFEHPGVSDIAKYIYNPEAKKKLSRFLQRKKYDVAHLHIYYGKLTSSILQPLKDRGIPIIQTLHDYKLVCATYRLFDGKKICFDCRNNQFYKCFLKKCNRNSYLRSGLSVTESYVSVWLGSQSQIDHFITVSDFQQAQFRKMGFKGENISTVHNFLSLEGYPVAYQTGDYVLYFGRVEKEKGVAVLLDAFELLPAGIRLVIAGDGTYRDEMLQRIETSPKLKSNVTYAGFHKKEALSTIIAEARFVIVPTIVYETFGLAVIEAMGHFKPVIGVNHGGITEIISQGEDGYRVTPGSAKEIAERTVELWNNEPLVKQMGHAGRKKVETQFSQEQHFEKIRAIYEKYTR
jgi:glycosyltransferase involved in cell wall biosynthesis